MQSTTWKPKGIQENSISGTGFRDKRKQEMESLAERNRKASYKQLPRFKTKAYRERCLWLNYPDRSEKRGEFQS